MGGSTRYSPRASQTGHGGAPASDRLVRPGGRVLRSRSSRNRGTSAASPPRVRPGGFLWRKIPCERGSNFIMRGARNPRFSLEKRLVRRCVTMLKCATKNHPGETDEKPLADRRCAARSRLRHAGTAQTGTGARAGTGAQAASHAGDQTRARGKARAEEARAGESLLARALRVQQGNAHERGESKA